MKYKIGFASESFEDTKKETAYPTQVKTIVPRRSVVQIYFPQRGMTLAYYNELFDLKVGDLVFVDGKLEGLRGRVTEVNYNFKIKLSDYQRVIAVADTEVHGEFFTASSHFVTFDPAVLPKEKALLWFKAPNNEDDEFVSGCDDTTFPLDDLKQMKVSSAIAERGHDYYLNNKVRYICLDGSRGFAIVEGNEAYEVEFDYHSGEISGLTCSCFCAYPCKHEFAAMLQLKETLEKIEKNYSEEYTRTGYFAAIDKDVLFYIAMSGKETGKITL